MKGPVLAIAFAAAVIIVAIIYAPRCDATSPDGFRLGSILMFGCDRSNNRRNRQREDLR
jgi:hypothetical protein